MSEELAAAVEAVNDIQPEAPAAEAEPESLDSDLPEGEDVFPRDYVEKLRAEAAKHRTRARDIESKFEGYTPEEKERFLELAHQLSTDPKAAYEEFAGVTERLAKQLGIEEKTMEETPTPAESAPAESAASALTPEAIDEIVSKRLEAERAAAAEQDDVKRTFAEAEALDPSYTDPAAKAHLFAVAQHNNTDLNGAHEIIMGKLNDAIEKAVDDYRTGLQSGKVHPPRLPAGDPASATADTGPPKTLEEAKARANERFNSMFGE